MDIISRKDALAQGLKHYFTGKPCKREHVAPRFVSTRQCSACQAHHEQVYYSENPAYREKRIAKAAKEYEAIKADPAKKAAYDERFARNSRARYAKDPERFKGATKATRAKYLDRYKAKACEAAKNRYDTDPVYRLTSSLRLRVLQAIKKCGAAKSTFTQELLGCTYEEARQHLAAQFLPGMTWGNHGEWEIDHIRPCASFDLTDPAQQRECFHYSNLQPLWRLDNRSKGDRLDWVPAAA
jgi:hypothetical protein